MSRPCKPRRAELPPAVDGRGNPVDRLMDAYLAQHHLARPQPIDDATFARRVYLDIIGLLPTPDELQAFLGDGGSDKRARLVRALLDRDVDYAEHWLTFWNDLLRNDYTGTGFITGGRRQITKWLYAALVDEHALRPVRPRADRAADGGSAGYGQGIRWRGDVNAGQTVEIQFAQSVGQSFLGINLKCASCHDSFIDRWKLDEAYGLAAVFSTRPLEIHRCDKPTGRTATAAWLFPELGQIDPQAAAARAAEAAGRADDASGKRPLHADHRQPPVAPLDGPRHRASRGRDADRAVERRLAGLPGRAPGRPRLRSEADHRTDRHVAGLSESRPSCGEGYRRPRLRVRRTARQAADGGTVRGCRLAD